MAPYEILSSDVTKDDDSNSRATYSFDSNPRPNNPPRIDKMKILIICMHIILFLGCIFLIYVIFVTPFLFEDDSNFKLTGEISNFSTQLNQSLIINVEEYSLNLDSGTELSGTNEQFTIENFSGILYLFNQSEFILKGYPNKILTKNSEISAKGQEITLTFQRGGVELDLEFVELNISDNLDLTYKPDLIYSTEQETLISINNFTGTLSYDSLIGMYGSIESFRIQNNNSNIQFD